MKRCPKCNRQYDRTLRFCLEDGTALSVDTRESQPAPTEILPMPAQPTLGPAADPTVQSYPNAGDFRPVRSQRPQGNPILIAGVMAIVLLLLALVGLAAYFVYQQSRRGESARTYQTVSDGANQNVSPTLKQGSTSATDTNRNGTTERSLGSDASNTPLKITPSASSVRLAVQANTYDPANAIDGRRSTAWIEGVEGPGLGEWIRFDFNREINLHRILILPGYFKSPRIWAQNNRLASVTAYFSDGTSRDLTFTDRMESQKTDIGSIRTKWVKFVIKSVYYGTDPDTAICEVAFEWEQ